MRELTCAGPRRVVWRNVPEPKLAGPREALVRPVIASRCDGDVLPVFRNLTTAMRLGVAIHYLDPITIDLLGKRPYSPPFGLGHECIAEVLECGEAVQDLKPGQLAIVPWAINCGACPRCTSGLTSKCSGVTPQGHVLSAYGFGPSMGPWGGAVCDVLRVPYADAMLVPVPESIEPIKLASASDNMPDAWRSVGPLLEENPGASVLVVGGSARSIGLYAAGMAVALGASRVDYLDHERERLDIAASLGAHPVERPAGDKWLNRYAPRVQGDFQITVEASSTVEGLRFALRSLLPGGTCTAVGFYFAKSSGIPLMHMYANSSTLKVGVSHARAVLPQVLELVAKGKFDPRKVTTLLANWDDAPEAFMTRTTKVVIARSLPTIARKGLPQSNH